MSSCDDIQNAWLTKVWAHRDIKDVSSLIYGYAITEDSDFEVSKLIDRGSINFWQFTVRPQFQFEMTSQTSKQFIVDVSYFIEKDTSGASWQVARNAIETVFNVAVSELGTNWNSTVDFWRPQQDPAAVQDSILGDQNVWRADFRFIGFQ